MYDIFKADHALSVKFLQGLLDEPEEFMEIMLEAVDATSRMYISQLIKFLLCHVKMIEKDSIMNNSMTDGRKDSVCARFIDYLIENLNQRVARAWSRFDEFLEIFYAYCVFSPQDIVDAGFGYTNTDPDPDSEAFKVGMTHYFSVKMLEKIGDFMLGEKSPFKAEGETRPSMGGTYSQPNFTQIMKLFNAMMSQ